MDERPTWTDCDEAGDFVVPNVLSPRDLVYRPDNMDETVPHTVWNSIPLCFSYLPCYLNFRVVNVSSRVSHMCAKRCSDALKAKVTDPNITVPEVEQLMTEFVRYEFLLNIQ